MDTLYLVVILGAVVAGFVQGLAGFGFGLTAMSIWVWVVDPRLAAALAVFGALVGQIVAAIAVRRGFNWRHLLPFLLGGLVGIPLGVAILPMLDVQTFKAVLGAFLVVCCPLMLWANKLPRITAGGRIADGLAGAIGGAMGGLGGFTGAIPTLWCTLRGMAKDEQRSIIQNFNLSALMVTMFTYVVSGIITVEMLPFLAVVAPSILIPSMLGARLYFGVSDSTFRQIVLGLLTASGLAMLASSVPVLLAR
jgi:uncharacterized membrane protein YfcA